MTKIIQYTHRPNNTELGKGNTHETYLLIGKEYDLSGLFPDGVDVNLKAVDRDAVYTIKTAIGREFRINQLGPLYRDYNVCEGDEIILTIVDENGSLNYYVRVNTYNRILLSQTNKGCMIGNIERIASYGDKNDGYEFNAVKNGVDGTLGIVFDGAKAKRSDSPDLTDFYTVTFNGERLENGTYYFDINDTTINSLDKASYNEVVINGEDLPSASLVKPNKTSTPTNYDKYLRALRTKPFMLLAGISGTGKSRIVRELAFKSCPEYLRDADGTTPGNYLMVEVKPNWHDSSELLGYYSHLANNGNGGYVFTPFTKFLVKAMMFPNVPFFVCLDEMNLAPVEQYFAEFLSVLETRKHDKDNYIQTGVLVKPEYFQGISDHVGDGYICTEFFPDGLPKIDYPVYTNTILTNKGLSLPDNVFVIGTVNMDDTTHQFSRKVIDRAMTIEMNGGKLTEMFGHSADLEYLPADQVWELEKFLPQYVNADEVVAAHPEYEWLIQTQLPAILEDINDVLRDTPFQVSYRVLNEMVIYFSVLVESGMPSEEAKNLAVDQMLLMKILPRIEGDRDMLMLDAQTCRLDKLEPFATSEETKKKIAEMKNRLNKQEFTRFWP